MSAQVCGANKATLWFDQLTMSGGILPINDNREPLQINEWRLTRVWVAPTIASFKPGHPSGAKELK